MEAGSILHETDLVAVPLNRVYLFGAWIPYSLVFSLEPLPSQPLAVNALDNYDWL